MITIKTKKLFSYLNAFEDLLPNQKNLFNKEAINNRLFHSDIYHDDSIEEDQIDIKYKKIAYLITYPENLFIKLQIPTNQEDLKSMLIDENDNILAYVAASYLNKESIEVDLEGNKDFAKTFFSISQKQNFEFSQKAIIIENNFTEVEWVVNEKLLSDSWRDKVFVLANLNGNNIDTNYKLVPPEFWEDASFFNKFIDKFNQHESSTFPIFSYALKHHKYNHNFINYIMASYKSFDLFEKHYFTDYMNYKNGVIDAPDLSYLEQLILKPTTLYQWLHHNYNSEIIKLCFPTEMLESKEIILEHYTITLNKSVSFDPIFNRELRNNNTTLPFLAKKTREWKLDLFDSLVNIHTENHPTSNSYKANRETLSFNYKYSFLLFENIDINKDFLNIVQNLTGQKQEIYMKCFFDYCQKKSFDLGPELSEIIINNYPTQFHLLNKEYRTLENLKKLLPFNISITNEEIFKFNDKDLNLSLISLFKEHILFNLFPKSYFKDEDYLLALIKNKSFHVQDEKVFIKFIESNKKLCKGFIDNGWHHKLSSKVFHDIELSEHLIGTFFSESTSVQQQKNYDHKIKSLVNPTVFSNSESLKNILVISNGYFLKHVSHLFKQKTFVKMVFQLYDDNKINNIEYLPANVRLILDSYKVTNNFEDFFIKYDLQNKLSKNLESKSKSIKITKI